MENLLVSFGSVMQTVGSVALAIIVLLVMITVHEFGHYTAGKIFGFGINEFAIGFGPAIYKRTAKNGEVFSVRCLPLGGFCSFKGEDEDDPDPSAFNNKKAWQRIIVLVSGAFMNYLLALVIIIFSFGVYGQSAYYVKQLDDTVVTVGQEYSFVGGDTILCVNGKNVYLATDLMKAIKGSKIDDTVDVTVLRNGKKQNVQIRLRSNGEFENIEDTNTLLIALGVKSLYSRSVRFGFFETLGRSFEYSFKLAGTIITVLGELLTGKLALTSVGGTVTTVTMAAKAVKTGGLSYLLSIASYIGVNLAVFNLLPIPALDGSRVVFALIEWIRGKPLNRKIEGVIHFVGLIVLMGFAILVDLLQLI